MHRTTYPLAILPSGALYFEGKHCEFIPCSSWYVGNGTRKGDPEVFLPLGVQSRKLSSTDFKRKITRSLHDIHAICPRHVTVRPRVARSEGGRVPLQN